MKILHLYKDYFPVVGGIENYVRWLAEAQAAAGHDVTVLVTSRDRRTHVEHLNGVRVIFSARLFQVSSAPVSLEFARWRAQLKANVTHLHSPYPPGELTDYYFGRSDATVLSYFSDIVRQRVFGKLYAPMLHRVLRRVDAIIATSPPHVQSSPILARWKDKVVVIPLGIRLKLEVENTPSANGAGQVRLLFVGRLRYYKGVDYLLRAVALLPHTRLTIVGTGPKEGEWKALARELSIDHRVDWAGEVSDDQLSAYYAGCDIFVLPSTEPSEAFGIVQLEAMAHGKPVVSCDVGTGVAWVNQNNVTGLVVSPRSAQALADALARLSTDPELRRRLGSAGQARVRAEFTLERMVERVQQVYETALTKRKKLQGA